MGKERRCNVPIYWLLVDFDFKQLIHISPNQLSPKIFTLKDSFTTSSKGYVIREVGGKRLLPPDWHLA